MSSENSDNQSTDRASFLAGLEFAASLCERMEATSPKRQYQEAAAWLAESIRQKGVTHAQQF